jgi:hypothetical protein
MQKALIAFGTLIAGCSCALSQTNTATVPGSLLILPQLQLRLPASPASPVEKGPAATPAEARQLRLSPPPDPEPFTPSPTNAAGFSSSLTLESEGATKSLAPYSGRDLDRFLARPDPDRLRLLSHPVDAIFEQESVPLGKGKFSCSILTAIKRRNPLCLLNPEFLRISW